MHDLNTEFFGDDQAIFRIRVFRSLAFISLQLEILNMP